LRQQLQADRLLGLDAVPIPPHDIDLWGQAPAAAAGSAASLADKRSQLAELDETQVKGCRKCRLCEGRTQTVFGQGNPDARLVFVGEAPGFEEDRQGLAFVGRAGQLLTKMIAAMGLARDDVYICNVIKCRPPNNREPAADEILACSGYLRRQLEIIQPEVLVALGAPAAKTLLNTADSIGKLRGRFHDYFFSGITGSGPSVPLMPTYHPAYLLRSPEEKRKAWEDLQMVMHLLELPLLQRGADHAGAE
jgi:DNA polymerase